MSDRTPLLSQRVVPPLTNKRSRSVSACWVIALPTEADRHRGISTQYIRPTGTLVAVGLPPDTFIKANVFFTGSSLRSCPCALFESAFVHSRVLSSLSHAVFYSKRIVGSYVGNVSLAASNSRYRVTEFRDGR